MIVKPLTDEFGVVVEAAPGDDVFALDRDEIVELFTTHGVVLFTGFDIDLAAFNRFAATFSDDFMTYKGGGYIRSAVEGQDETVLSTRYDYGRERQDTFGLPLHGEMYYTDRRPIILWFFCARPAESDGETTICDGKRIYDELDDGWKRLLDQKRLKYLRKYRDGEWQLIYQTENIDTAVEFCRGNGLDASVDRETNTLFTEYVHPAVITSRWGGHKVYINNILPVMWQERMGRDTSVVRFEDGSKLPREMIDEVAAIQSRIMVPIKWRPQDFVMIDNTRTLHGRRPFTDTDREVYLRMVHDVPF